MKEGLIMKNKYSIEGVKCGGCVAAVKEKLSKLDNVDNIEINIQEKTIEVEGTASKEELQAALSDTNYKIV
jgi:copper-exporting ATPase